MELRTKISKLLSDIPGDIDPDDEVKIIDNAYKKLFSSKKPVNEESIIDAVLAAFKDEEEEIYFEENPFEDELFELLRVSSYDDDTIRDAISSFEKEAASEYDKHRGAKGCYYDLKGKDYRPEKSNKNPEMGELKIRDGNHDEIEYHNLATETDDVKRSRADMLVRSAI